jgi:GTP-binding protein Era
VREKLLKRTSEELPHSIAVSTDELIERDDGVLEIYSRVLVERESQKGMVIGKGGRLLKEAGTEARLEIEVLFGRRVYLDIRVKVERDWQRRPHALDRLGFGH